MLAERHVDLSNGLGVDGGVMGAYKRPLHHQLERLLERAVPVGELLLDHVSLDAHAASRREDSLVSEIIWHAQFAHCLLQHLEVPAQPPADQSHAAMDQLDDLQSYAGSEAGMALKLGVGESVDSGGIGANLLERFELLVEDLLQLLPVIGVQIDLPQTHGDDLGDLGWIVVRGLQVD